MTIVEGAIYTSGKPMMRKVIKIDGERVTFAKCMFTVKGLHIVGGGSHFLNTILVSSFKKWALTEVGG
jgi:hypothetical protein